MILPECQFYIIKYFLYL